MKSSIAIKKVGSIYDEYVNFKNGVLYIHGCKVTADKDTDINYIKDAIVNLIEMGVDVDDIKSVAGDYYQSTDFVKPETIEQVKSKNDFDKVQAIKNTIKEMSKGFTTPLFKERRKYQTIFYDSKIGTARSFHNNKDLTVTPIELHGIEWSAPNSDGVIFATNRNNLVKLSNGHFKHSNQWYVNAVYFAELKNEFLGGEYYYIAIQTGDISIKQGAFKTKTGMTGAGAGDAKMRSWGWDFDTTR